MPRSAAAAALEPVPAPTRLHAMMKTGEILRQEGGTWTRSRKKYSHAPNRPAHYDR